MIRKSGKGKTVKGRNYTWEIHFHPYSATYEVKINNEFWSSCDSMNNALAEVNYYHNHF